MADTSIYRKFDHKFDVSYQIGSPEKVDLFINDTKSLLQMITESTRPTTHLKVLIFMKVAMRVLSWKTGDRATLMSLLWHVLSEVSRSFPIAYPQSKFPNGGGKNMPTYIALLGDLTLESYYRFMQAHVEESALFAKNAWPTLVGDLSNTYALNHLSQFLRSGAIDVVTVVLEKCLERLTASDAALRTIMVFLASKCGPAYESFWDEGKEDVLSLYRALFEKSSSSNELIKHYAYGDVPEDQAYTFAATMGFRGWRPPGDTYLALYRSFLLKYKSLINMNLVNFESTNYVTVEKEFGYLLQRIILDSKVNSMSLNKECLALLTAMVQHHFKTGTKPLVRLIEVLYNLTQNVESQFHESRRLEQFKTILLFQALGEALTTSYLKYCRPSRKTVEVKKDSKRKKARRFFPYWAVPCRNQTSL